jgi:hypothetical protein
VDFHRIATTLRMTQRVPIIEITRQKVALSRRVLMQNYRRGEKQPVHPVSGHRATYKQWDFAIKEWYSFTHNEGVER